MTIERTREVWKRAADFPQTRVGLSRARDGAGIRRERAEARLGIRLWRWRGHAELSAASLSRLVRDVVPENVERTTTRVLQVNKKNSAWASCSTTRPRSRWRRLLRNRSTVTACCITSPTRRWLRACSEEFYRLLKTGGALYLMLYTEQMWSDFELKMKSLVDPAARRERIRGVRVVQ